MSLLLLVAGLSPGVARASVEAAQQPTVRVTGTVSDATGPLPGANVIVKGQVRGSITDTEGKFTIEVQPTDVLEFSFLGFETQEVTVGQKRTFTIILEPKKNELDEVTVVAFGTQKKSSVVSAIETVSAKDLRISSSNMTNAFAGRIAGVISYQDSGEPGADNAKFFIRGVSSFGLKVDPLILIDGIEGTTDDLARIQPDDIEQFSVLKDATSTALYGPRGANGIIVVQTKVGQEGKLKVSGRIDNNVATPTRFLELISAVDYMQMYNQARMSRNPELGPLYSEQKIQSTARGEYPILYPNIDWYDYLFKKQTINTKTYLSLSGGGKVATYHVSGGYDHETGLLKVDEKNAFNTNISINRFHMRSNVNFNLGPTSKLETKIFGRFTRYNGPFRSANDIYSGVLNSNPVDFPPVYEPDEAHKYSDYILFGSVILPGTETPKTNPYAEMVRGYNGKDEATIEAQVTFKQDLDFITQNLKFQVTVSETVNTSNSATRTYSPLYFGIDTYNPVTGDYKLLQLNPTAQYPRLGDIASVRDVSGHTYLEARFNWNRTFGKHNVGAMNVTMMDEATDYNGGSSIFEALPQRNVGNSGRLTYDYDDRYFLEFAYGYNGSEKFTGKRRYGFFPTIGGGYMVSNEEYFQDIKDALLIDAFKLRGTYGLVGNDAIAERQDRFHFLSWIETGGAGATWGKTFSTSYGGYVIRRYANPDITWELSKKINLGMELSFLKNGDLKFVADYFEDHRSNIYWARNSIPESVGLEAGISGNVGKVLSRGFDGSIDFNHSFSAEAWMQVRGNFTYAKNKVMERDEENFADKYLSQIGQSVNQLQGYVAERLFVDEAEIAGSPVQQLGGSGIYQAGDIKYTDVNGDGVVNTNDRVWMGYPTVPEIQYGFGVSAGWKNFDASFFFQGNAHVSFFINPGTGNGIAPFVDQRNALAIVARDAWTETDPDVHSFWPRLSTNLLSNNTQNSSWWLRDGSLLRMKTLEIGYNVRNWKKLAENIRVYVTAENLFCLSHFKMWDPEMGGNGMQYPLNRRFNIGININF
ncbi:MAG: TonB-dependent receptor [Bacteroidales bacterium]|nr:TonB-dependent receptor [Bacteroidales bacterium]